MPEPPHTADLAIVRAVLRGDDEAMQPFSDRLTCVDRILTARNSRSGGWLDSHELEDLGQEVRAVVWRRLSDYRAIAALSSWIFGICELQLRNAVRNKRRRPKVANLDSEKQQAAREEAPEPEFYSHVHAGIDRLEPIDQRILRLKYFEELTLEEVAKTLHLNLNTVKSRYFRALKRMRTSMRSLSTEPQS